MDPVGSHNSTARRHGLGFGLGLLAAISIASLLGCPRSKTSTDSNSPADADARTRSPRAGYALTLSADTTCRPDRLTTVNFEVPLPSFDRHEGQAIEFALNNQGHVIDGELVQFVPRVSYQRRLTSVLALRYDIDGGQWLAPSEYAIPQTRGMLPVASSLETYERDTDLLLVWDAGRSGKVGVRYSQGAWTPASDDDGMGALNWREGLARSVAHPENPDPATGVSVEADADNPRLFSFHGHSGEPLGSVEFPSLAGHYAGMFTDTRAALFWPPELDPMAEETKSLLFEQLPHGYLVDVDTGQSCRIARRFGANSPSIYRLGDRLLLIHAAADRSWPLELSARGALRASGASSVLRRSRGVDRRHRTLRAVQAAG